MTDAHIPPPLSGRVAAVVLAAGRSTRMGGFKPLLPFGATNVIGHVVGTLTAAGIAEIVVVAGHRADELAAALAALPVRVVVNHDFDRGMYSSIRTGIAALPPTVAGTLLLPVDVPLVRASTFRAIAEAGLAGDATVLHPTFRGERGHPPFLARRLFAEIGEAEPAGGLAGLLERRRTETAEIAVIDRGILLDMDRPEDHARLAAALSHRRHPEPAECEAVLEAAATPEPVRRHCRAVARLATALAEGLVLVGLPVDPDRVRAAALLHDVAKGHPRHAEIGADLVACFGFPDLADPIGRHMDLGIDPAAGEPVLDDAAVLHLADRLVCEDRRVSLEERFAPALSRFRDSPDALAGARRRLAVAEALLHAVEARIELPSEPPPVRPVAAFRVEVSLSR